jgi:molybdopterin molybdotransferase
MRATLTQGPRGFEVAPATAQDSSLTSVLAAANALLIRPENAGPLPAGAPVPVLPL